jgi:Bacterial Ig domain
MSMITSRNFKLLSGRWINRIRRILALVMVLLFAASAARADVNVLIVGTTTDKGASYGGTSKPFDISKVRTELQSILSGVATLGTVRVGLHDFKSNSTAGNSLIYEFYANNASYAPVATQVWQEVRGERGTNWNYVILFDEPFTTERYPGYYTHGVAEFGKEAAKGGAETVLLMGWPGSGSSATVSNYQEVVYRTGRSLGYKVAPAGLAWQAEGSVYGTTHPTADGAYIAAASIYSRIWGQSASASSYANTKDALADRVHQVVTNNIGKQQYSGRYNQHPTDVLTIMHNPARAYGFGGVSSSTENGLKDMAKTIAKENGLDMTAPVGTGLPWISGIYVNRDWLTNPGFPMCTRFQHPGNGTYDSADHISWIVSSSPASDVSALRSSESTLSSHSGFRHLPTQLLWAQFAKEYPSEPLIESSHGSRHWKRVQGAYMFTMFTGRCAIGPKPAEGTADYKDYVSSRIGYETAWRFSTLQGRAPGFKIMPSYLEHHAVDPETPEIMTVQFVLPPQSNVTVSISTDQPWATVSPQTLIFASNDVATVRQVTVAVTPEAASHRGEYFNVIFNTSSGDEVCDGLSESWQYKVNVLPVPVAKTAEVVMDGSVDVTLSNVDDDPKQDHTYAASKAPANGTVVVIGPTATYNPNPGFVGLDSFEYVVNDGLVTSPTTARVDVVVYASKVYNFNLVFNPSAELVPLPEYGFPGVWESVVGTSGNPSRTGSRLFKLPVDAVSGEGYQDVILKSFASLIDAGLQSFMVGGYCKDGADDDVRLVLEFRDATGKVLGTPYVSDRANSAVWKQIRMPVLAPAGARIARFILRGTRLAGGQTEAMVEDISLIAIKPGNSAPVATDPPLASIAVDTPTVIPLTATDVDGDKLTYSIVPGKGPRFGTIVGQNENGMPIYKSNPAYLGNDSFTYVANDGQLDSNEALATITNRANAAPVIVSLRPRSLNINVRVYMTLSNGILGEGVVTDDGAPANPGKLTYTWSKQAGDLTVTFSDPNSSKTSINWGEMNVGTATIRFSVSDGQKTTSQSFTIEVLSDYNGAPGNVAPQVDVGGPYEGVVVGVPLQLDGVDFFDDGQPAADPGYTTVEWLLLSGPGNATFNNPYQYKPVVTFDYPGTYVLRLTANDGWIKVYEDVTITVAGNAPPRASDGVVTTKMETAVSILLAATDAEGDTMTYSYTLPAHGILTGTAPNLTYTPAAGYLGSDSFIFTARDATHTSNVAKVSITVERFPGEAIVVQPATQVNASSAVLNGQWISPGGTVYRIDVFWGQTDGGTNAGAWAHSAMAGTFTNNVTPSFSHTVSGLSLATAYHYAFRATNATKTVWTRPSGAFAIGVPPTVDITLGAMEVSEASAMLLGVLTAGSSANAWFCWGASDGGITRTGDWDHVLPLGEVTDGVAFSGVVTGLTANSTYFYRCYVENAFGSNWSGTAEIFSTIPSGIGGGGPLGGMYFEWDAKLDTGGNSTWSSTTINSYNWTFDSGNLSPVTVADARFNRLHNAYAFPAAKDASSTSWSGMGDTQPATFEFVIDVDTNNCSIFETGASGDGLQVDIVNGVLRGTVAETNTTRASYQLTAEDMGRFIHVVFVADNANNVIQLYVDGVLRDSQPWTLGEDWSATGAASLGGNNGGPAGGSTASFKGKMALFRYYRNKAFTAAEVTTNFNALSTIGAVANLAPTLISSTSATLNADLDATDTSCDVYVYYGTSNGNSNAGGWSASAYVGSWTNVSDGISHPLNSLLANTTYSYTFMVSNTAGMVWATPSWTFTTRGTIAPPATTTNHAVPHAWLSTINPSWSTNLEAAVLADPDNDGFATWQEYWSGTDPQDSNSCLKIDSILFNGTNLFVSWRHARVDAGIPPITIQARTNLVSGSWVPVGAHAPVNGVNTWSAGSSVQGYYRLAVTNAP